MNAEKDIIAIPSQGIPAELLIQELKTMQLRDVSWKEGKTWSLVYYADEYHDRLLKDAYLEYFSANYLNPLAFKSLLKMEQDVVRMTANLLNGGNEVCGTMTSGGTESILLAVYTCREKARKEKPSIKVPEIVAPRSIHPAFDKAAHLFGLKIKKAPIDGNQRVVPGALEKLIGRNTIMVAASAPNYHSGTLDPISEIGAIAKKYNLPFHVDACMGGFMLPWIEKLGIKLESWDFRVPGVTSVSADVHKFGYGAKGASVLLHRNMEQMRHQFFISTDFPGGIYASPTLLGTRPGGPIAAAWAGLKHLGEEGYLNLARQVLNGTKQLRAELEEIPGVVIIGNPCMNILAVKTKANNPDIFAVADQLEKRGWMIDRQQYPNSIHLTVYPTNLKVISGFAEDVKSAVEFALANPKSAFEGNAALYGLMSRVPLRGMVGKQVRKVLEGMYGKQSDENEGAPGISPDPPRWIGLLNRILSLFN